MDFNSRKPRELANYKQPLIVGDLLRMVVNKILAGAFAVRLRTLAGPVAIAVVGLVGLYLTIHYWPAN